MNLPDSRTLHRAASSHSAGIRLAQTTNYAKVTARKQPRNACPVRPERSRREQGRGMTEHFLSSNRLTPFEITLMHKMRPQLAQNHIDARSLDLKRPVLILMRKKWGAGVLASPRELGQFGSNGSGTGLSRSTSGERKGDPPGTPACLSPMPARRRSPYADRAGRRKMDRLYNTT